MSSECDNRRIITLFAEFKNARVKRDLVFFILAMRDDYKIPNNDTFYSLWERKLDELNEMTIKTILFIIPQIDKERVIKLGYNKKVKDLFMDFKKAKAKKDIVSFLSSIHNEGKEAILSLNTLTGKQLDELAIKDILSILSQEC